MILVISNLGMGGVVGDTISTVSFGVIGLLAYIFPVLLFLGAIFLVSIEKIRWHIKSFWQALCFCILMRPGAAFDRGLYEKHYAGGLLYPLF